jgi:hypothetical protein
MNSFGLLPQLTRSILLSFALGPASLAAGPDELDPATFFRKSAPEQQEIIWREVESSAYEVLPEQDQAPPNNWDLLFKSENLVKVFQYQSIVMPAGREKATHQFGTVAKVEFEARGSGRGYTGIFNTGALGILRLALAKANPAAGGHLAYIPNLSLKMLRDGQMDSNILAMHSIEGSGKETNFLAHSFSNFPGPGISLSLRVFSGSLEHALGVHTKDWSHLRERARVIPLAESSLQERDGTVVGFPHAPYEVIFVPNMKFYGHFQDKFGQAPADDANAFKKAMDFRRIFAEPVFDNGEVLFEIYARDKEDAVALWEQHWGSRWPQFKAWWEGNGYSYEEELHDVPAKSVYIGRLVLKSRFVASRFGDQLPFRHPTIHERVGRMD